MSNLNKQQKNKLLQEQADVLYTQIKVLLDNDKATQDHIHKAKISAYNSSLAVDVQEKAIAFLMCLDRIKAFVKSYTKKGFFVGNEQDLEEIETHLYFVKFLNGF